VQDRLALVWPGPPPELVAQHRGRGRRELGAGELADGGLGALARSRMVQGRQEARELPAGAARSIEPMASNREDPGTRLVIRSRGSVLLATTSGRNGTRASLVSAVRTPISRARRSAAGRDHANFTMNCSPAARAARLPQQVFLAGRPGTAMEHPLSSGATTRRASPGAAAEHSASQVIPGTPATS
jgi:hypothetical protein